MSFNSIIKTPLEALKDNLHVFIAYDIDNLYSELISDGLSEYDVCQKLYIHVLITENEFFKSISTSAFNNFTEDYFMEMMNKKYWSLYSPH